MNRLSDYVRGILTKDRQIISKAITLVESSLDADRALSINLLKELNKIQKDKPPSFKIGISGPPGVGKSTFIESLGLEFLKSTQFKSLGVMAVDPSSKKTGGSILGDKTRMGKLMLHPSLPYIRPSPSRGTLGGLAGESHLVLTLLEAASYEIILVETVGVGQSEAAIADLVDLNILLLGPGGGDEIQAMKKGNFETADAFVVNKADGELLALANHTALDLKAALRFHNQNIFVASSMTGKGVPEIVAFLEKSFNESMQNGSFHAKRKEQVLNMLYYLCENELIRKFKHFYKQEDFVLQCGKDLTNSTEIPIAVAEEITNYFVNKEHESNVDCKIKAKADSEDKENISLPDGQVKASRSESRIAAKKLKNERKAASTGDLFNTIVEAKASWEILRRKSLSEKERKSHLEKLFRILKGNVYEIALKHDSSRVVQIALKFADKNQRHALAKELEGHFIELSKNKYGKFLAKKLLLYSTPETRKTIFTQIKGNAKSMFKHKESNVVLEDWFVSYANSSQKNQIISEFYGPEFSLFKEKQVCENMTVLKTKLNETKIDPIRKNLSESLSEIISKGGFSSYIFHRLLLDYLELIDSPSSSHFKDLIEMVKDHVPEFIHTKDGVKSAIKLFCFANQKDRKTIIKSLKPFLDKIIIEDIGYLFLICVLAVTDDTVLVNKIITNELCNKFTEMISTKPGRLILLFIISKGNPSPKAFSTDVLSLFQSFSFLTVETSKKEQNLRSNEIFSALQNSWSTFLLKDITEMAKLVQEIDGINLLSQTVISIEDQAKKREIMSFLLSMKIEKTERFSKMLRTLLPDPVLHEIIVSYCMENIKEFVCHEDFSFLLVALVDKSNNEFIRLLQKEMKKFSSSELKGPKLLMEKLKNK